jgi:hypothetical protein
LSDCILKDDDDDDDDYEDWKLPSTFNWDSYSTRT